MTAEDGILVVAGWLTLRGLPVQHTTLALTSPRRTVGRARSDQSACHVVPPCSPTVSLTPEMFRNTKFVNIFYVDYAEAVASRVNRVVFVEVVFYDFL